jgi:hypothetical protein
MRQIEESAQHISVYAGPLSFLLASDAFTAMLQNVLTESVSPDAPDRARALADVEQIMDILRERKALYQSRRPTVVNLMSAFEIERFLDHGFVGRRELPPQIMAERKALARAEIEHFASIVDAQPIGVQIGIVTDTLPHAGFHIFRQQDRKLLVLSPFRLGGEPNIRVGVAMITSAPDAIAMHEKAVNDMWQRALKGRDAAQCLRGLLATA